MAILAKENLVGAWAFLVGCVLAIIVGLVASISKAPTVNPIFLIILAVLGIVVGYFVAEKDVRTFLIATVAVVIVSYAGLQGVVINFGLVLNKLVTSILGALLFLFIPATIIVALKTVFSLAKS